jgi:hypothetical protein
MGRQVEGSISVWGWIMRRRSWKVGVLGGWCVFLLLGELSLLGLWCFAVVASWGGRVFCNVLH